ncbi:MAG: diacylglycerol kinase family lipid kinase [Planctomycetota bacterium]|nr:diacylglycerol kinase family lipid kinase [Planctomycetota bacterium]
MKQSDRRTTFVVNPYAGAGMAGRRWAARESMLREHFPLGEILFTRAAGDATHIAKDAVERGQDYIIAVGGDGTVHEVVNGLMLAELPEPKYKPKPILGIWPAGRGSDFARGVGIPGDPAMALELLVAGKAQSVDIGFIQCRDEGGKQVERYFLNAVDFGIGAVVCERLTKKPWFMPGRPTYLWQTVRTLLTFRNPTVSFASDDHPLVTKKIITVVIANNAYFGGGMCIAPDARVNDGELDLVVVGDLRRFEAIRRLGETFSGNRILHPDVHYSRCKRLEARSESKVLLEADGELVGHLPATLELAERRLKIVVGTAVGSPSRNR